MERLVSRKKSHISANLVCHREKNKGGRRRNQEPVLRPFSFLLYVHISDFFTGAGMWVLSNLS